VTHQEPIVRERTDMLDSLGNTTAATGKGFAIGSAALTALALLAAYVITVQASLSQQVATAQEVEQPTEVSAVDEQFALPMEEAYYGYGLLRVPRPDDPESYDAGMVLDPKARPALQQAEQADGDVRMQYDEEHGVYTASVRADGEETRFDVAPASAASLPQLMRYYDVTITNPKVLCGLFVGVMLVFVFCAMTMNAVGRAAYRMMGECRRQFTIMKEAFRRRGMSEEPTQWPYEVTNDDHKYPDYASCVEISTQGALKEMVTPSLMAVIVPIVLGLLLGVAGVMGMLAGALISGFAVAIFMANAGGAWDNAKKYIETGQYGGKGSEAHKAGVVGDTVGDPFKDTSGPALNILIKLISVVSVVFAGVVVKYSPIIANAIGLG
jgi:Na+/H+-translocating membrane pyrophosphatase